MTPLDMYRRIMICSRRYAVYEIAVKCVKYIYYAFVIATLAGSYNEYFRVNANILLKLCGWATSMKFNYGLLLSTSMHAK